MKLTPQDISNQNFASKIKGFDRDEVKNFLMQVVETLESEIKEKEELKKGLEKFRENCAKYERREELLRDTLIAAQKFSSEIKLNAQKEGELIVKEAEMKAEEIVHLAIGRQRLIKEEIKNLKFRRNEIETDIVNMLNSLKEMIETYHKEDEDFDKIEFMGK